MRLIEMEAPRRLCPLRDLDGNPVLGSVGLDIIDRGRIEAVVIMRIAYYILHKVYSLGAPRPTPAYCALKPSGAPSFLR